MKFQAIKSIPLTAVSGCKDVTLSVGKDESDELRAALKVVDKYKKAAFDAIVFGGSDPRDSDWHMVAYRVKNDKVIVSVTDGMAG